MPGSLCQVPGVYLWAVGGFCAGMCGDFVTRGCLTFVRECDSLHAKITRSQHIYKHIIHLLIDTNSYHYHLFINNHYQDLTNTNTFFNTFLIEKT